mmetsp:Transcript_4758/g.14101  ORF Transcript_4758/g.14101 Transcript_4758/m.14101 type:complete len:272 (-) Transcript_4758:15-830(-)
MDLHCSAHGRLDVVSLWFRSVEEFYWVTPARHLEERGIVEVTLELDRVEGGGHDNKLEVFALHEDFFQETHEHICGQSPFMGFIQYNALVALEQRVGHSLSQEHAICHELEDGRLVCHVVEADRVPDLLPELHVHLLSDPAGNGHGGDTTRLRARHHSLLAIFEACVACLDEKLGNLGGLAGPSLTLHHDGLGLLDAGKQLVEELVDRELLTDSQNLVVLIAVGPHGQWVHIARRAGGSASRWQVRVMSLGVLRVPVSTPNVNLPLPLHRP